MIILVDFECRTCACLVKKKKPLNKDLKTKEPNPNYEVRVRSLMAEMVGYIYTSFRWQSRTQMGSNQITTPQNKKHPQRAFSVLAEMVVFEPTCRLSPTKRFRVVLVMTTSIHLRIKNTLILYTIYNPKANKI